MAESRIESILENILGGNNTIRPPFSRNEALLLQISEQLEEAPGEPVTSQEIQAIINSIS